ncbi:uncharacterized protein [Temnothorax longispinosus]|uniref:uncharacterized protein n=1 Tax=Temnothorax longispinosus TaxID=300112 RepID=UPI003A994F25
MVKRSDKAGQKMMMSKKEDKMTDKNKGKKDKTDTNAGNTEMHMETDQEVSRDKDEMQLVNNVLTNGRESEEGENNDGRESDKRENNGNYAFGEIIYVNIKGKLVKKDRNLRKEEIAKELSGKYFEPGLKGYKIVCCKLTRENTCAKKGLNEVKIRSLLHSIRCIPDNLEMDRFNLARLKFKNDEEANRCIERLNKEYKDKLQVYIDNRSRYCKGVIADWPYSIEELWENLVRKDNILQLEVMKKRIYNREMKKIEIKETDNIIITIKGSKLPERFSIFEGFGSLKVRPYVEPVSQYFRCFKYGHFKNNCKSKDLCGRCGSTAHGPCDFGYKCVNCKGKHRATDRKCPIYVKNKEIKIAMAKNNATYTEAIKIINGQDAKEQEYDKYNRKAWPKIDERLRNKNPVNRENSNYENNERKTYAKAVANAGTTKPTNKDEYYSRTINKIKENEYDRNRIARTKETETSRLPIWKERKKEDYIKKNNNEEQRREVGEGNNENKLNYLNIKEVLEEEDWKRFIREQIQSIIQQEVEKTIGIRSTSTEDITEEVNAEGEASDNYNSSKRQRT